MRELESCKFKLFIVVFLMKLIILFLFREKDNAHVRGKWKEIKAKHKKLESDSVNNILLNNACI